MAFSAASTSTAFESEASAVILRSSSACSICSSAFRSLSSRRSSSTRVTLPWSLSAASCAFSNSAAATSSEATAKRTSTSLLAFATAWSCSALALRRSNCGWLSSILAITSPALIESPSRTRRSMSTPPSLAGTFASFRTDTRQCSRTGSAALRAEADGATGGAAGSARAATLTVNRAMTGEKRTMTSGSRPAPRGARGAMLCGDVTTDGTESGIG